MTKELYDKSAVYSGLGRLGRTGLAWECMRRNSEYRSHYRSLPNKTDADKELSERWGLSFPSDPDLPAALAGVIWDPHVNPATVFVGPVPEDFPGAFRIGMLKPVLSRRGSRGEHLLVEGARDPVPVMLLPGVDDATPLGVVIAPDGDFETRIAAARGLWRLMNGLKPCTDADDLARAQRRNVILAIWAADLRRGGFSIRQTAVAIFGEAKVPSGREWRSHRLYGLTMRLIDRGIKLIEGGYRDLLRKKRRLRRPIP